MSAMKLCTFSLNGVMFGLGVDSVQEVVRDQEPTPVPLAHPSITGLVNLRGQVLTAVDGRHRLGLPIRLPGDDTVMFIVRTAHEPVALVADDEGDVVAFDEDELEEVPHTVSESLRSLATAALKLDQSLLLVLDGERTLALDRTD